LQSIATYFQSVVTYIEERDSKRLHNACDGISYTLSAQYSVRRIRISHSACDLLRGLTQLEIGSDTVWLQHSGQSVISTDRERVLNLIL